MNPLMMTDMGIIVIGGLKHCGKSTLGRLIARDLGYQFYDLDDLIREETNGIWDSVREIWKTFGQEEFQRLEEEAARSFIDWHIPGLKEPGAVLSLGGGTIENPGAMTWLKNRGLNVYVRAPKNLLYGRIMAKGRPPFLSQENPQSDWDGLYEKRDALLERFADIIHDVDDSEAKINAQRLLLKMERSE